MVMHYHKLNMRRFNINVSQNKIRIQMEKT